MTLDGLNRSDVVAGLQCDLRLFLKRKQEQKGSKRHPNQRHTRLYKAAHLRFPDGKALDGDLVQRKQMTKEALGTAGPWTLFGASLEHAHVEIQPDILHKTAENKIELFAVRGSTSIKRTTYYELAVDVWGLRGMGHAPSSASVLHINSDYCRNEDGIDPHQLFQCKETLTFLEGRISEIEAQVEQLNKQRCWDTPPPATVGPHCQKPSRCPFLSGCSPTPGPFHISRLPHGSRLAQRLSSEAIEDIRVMPEPMRMSPMQRRALACLQRGEDWVGPGLERALQAVQFPLGYLDFEAVAPPVPLHAHTQPHQSLPTQWSLHVEDPSGELTHQEFIHDENSDPRLAFVESLVDAVSEVRTLVVYSPAESRILKTLAEQFPEHAGSLRQIRKRLHDLLAVIQRHYYHPDFNGTFTLKRVLPSLVDDLDYQDLDIRDGAMAARLYPDLILAEPESKAHQSLRDSLLRYCERDTLALVRIRQALLKRCAYSSHKTTPLMEKWMPCRDLESEKS